MLSLTHHHFLIFVIGSNCLHFQILLFIFSCSWGILIDIFAKYRATSSCLPPNMIISSSHSNIAIDSDLWHVSIAFSVLLKFHHCYISFWLLNSILAPILILNIASETACRLFSLGIRSSSISEEIMACVTLRVFAPPSYQHFQESGSLLNALFNTMIMPLFFLNQFLFRFC